MIRTTLDQLLLGTPRPFRDDGEMSAIFKTATQESVYLEPTGLKGNQVADPVHHGGRDKAVHLYPIEHYDWWQNKYPDLEILKKPGAFGENLSCSGLTEDKLCLGDTFRIGEALIECSHARQPCWKLNHRFGRKDVMKTVIQTGRSGSYFRVLEPGYVQAGDGFEQCERPHPDWPLDRLFRMLIGGDHRNSKTELQTLANMPVLAERWRQRASALAAKT